MKRPWTVKEALTIAAFPAVRFIQLEPQADNDPVTFIVEGACRAERENASKRFAAAMVEFGSRRSDLVFHDVDDMVGS